jgi:hypothetical protein
LPNLARHGGDSTAPLGSRPTRTSRTTRKKVQEALKAQAEQLAAGDRIERGVPTQVFVGEKHRQLATKYAKTKAGDVLKEGVAGLYAGPGGKPVSVVGSQTVQGKTVKNGVRSHRRRRTAYATRRAAATLSRGRCAPSVSMGTSDVLDPGLGDGRYRSLRRRIDA